MNHMVKEKKRIGELLVGSGAITEEELQKGLKQQKISGDPLGSTIVKLGLLTEHDLVTILSQQLDIPYLFLENYLFDPATVKLIPEDYARHNRVIPLFQIENTLTIGISDPSHIDIFDELSRMTKMEVEPTLCAESEIMEALDEQYGTSKSMDDVLQKIRTMDKNKGDGEDSPMIQLVELMIEQAVKLKASDIHVEPDEHVVRVRYRVDGIMETIFEHPSDLQDEIISRIKVMSDLNIAEKRLPQDGRFKNVVEEKPYDYRVSTLPTYHGENIVIWILDQSSVEVKLEQLGMTKDMLAQFKSIIHEPNGIILVTGPTGSGKTTTLYSALNALNSPAKNIVTIEDPVEYRLPVIRQSNVNHKIGLTFANGLRAILRQDPDIIMIGEIRDTETASVAVQAALTGHLVLSTLHTNDTVSSITRLIDMGVEPFLVSSSTKAILAQRLVRRLCPKCKQPYEPNEGILKDMGVFNIKTKVTFYKGAGCKFCRKQGYKGRVGLYEFLHLNENIRRLIVTGGSYDTILKQALQDGLIQLKYDGFRKVLQGATSIDEVIRVT